MSSGVQWSPQGYSGPSVTVVAGGTNGPPRAARTTTRQDLKIKHMEAWIVIGLLTATTVLAVFDLFLLLTGFK
jgi:hypothetical protein